MKRRLLREKPFKITANGASMLMTIAKSSGWRPGEKVWQVQMGSGEILLTKKLPLALFVKK